MTHIFLSTILAAAVVQADSLESVLRRMDEGAKKFKSVTANLKEVSYTAVLQETSTQTGDLRLQRRKNGVIGVLHFTTVTALLRAGTEAIGNGRAAIIDLAAVQDSDSSGLALLIEWLSVAKASGRALRYENIPAQLHQLARLSDVEELLAGG